LYFGSDYGEARDYQTCNPGIDTSSPALQQRLSTSKATDPQNIVINYS
jgi:hypothetical protein